MPSFKGGILQLQRKEIIRSRFGILGLLCSFWYTLYAPTIISVVIKEQVLFFAKANENIKLLHNTFLF